MHILFGIQLILLHFFCLMVVCSFVCFMIYITVVNISVIYVMAYRILKKMCNFIRKINRELSSLTQRFIEMPLSLIDNCYSRLELLILTKYYYSIYQMHVWYYCYNNECCYFYVCNVVFLNSLSRNYVFKYGMHQLYQCTYKGYEKWTKFQMANRCAGSWRFNGTCSRLDQCLFTKIIFRKILIEFLHKVIQNVQTILERINR